MSKHHRNRNVPPASWRAEIKRNVIKEHGLVCWLCTLPIASFQEATMDHVKKASKGGEFIEANLRPAHAKCNNERHRKRPRVETAQPEEKKT